MIDIEPVLEAAREAKANGSTRFCMGAAWRDLAGRKSGFEKILKMVTEVRGMGMEGESPLCRGSSVHADESLYYLGYAFT